MDNKNTKYKINYKMLHSFDKMVGGLYHLDTVEAFQRDATGRYTVPVAPDATIRRYQEILFDLLTAKYSTINQIIRRERFINGGDYAIVTRANDFDIVIVLPTNDEYTFYNVHFRDPLTGIITYTNENIKVQLTGHNIVSANPEEEIADVWSTDYGSADHVFEENTRVASRAAAAAHEAEVHESGPILVAVPVSTASTRK